MLDYHRHALLLQLLLQLANKVKTTYGYYNNIMTIIAAPATHAVRRLQHRSSHTSHCKLQLYHITSLEKQVRRLEHVVAKLGGC